jgi:hypothetical protein
MIEQSLTGLRIDERDDSRAVRLSSEAVGGRWMNFQEVSALGNRWSYLELMEILEWGVAPYESRERPCPDVASGTTRKVKEYWITNDSLGTFS